MPGNRMRRLLVEQQFLRERERKFRQRQRQCERKFRERERELGGIF